MNPVGLGKYEKTAWVKVWSGKWSFHTCSHFGESWTVRNKVSGKPVFPNVAYIHRNGITDCWVPQADKDDLGDKLVKRIKADHHAARIIAISLKANADKVLSFIKSNKGRNISPSVYEKYWKMISDYYQPHVSVKYIVDYLQPEDLKAHLPVLEEARLYAEPVFREQENFMEKIAVQIAEESGYSKQNILCTTKEELRKYFKGRALPGKPLLEKRFALSVQLFESGKSRIYTGKDALELERALLPKTSQNEVRGQVAYKGKAKGKARIVIDPFKYKDSFQKGDVLVTGMTRPEFIPLMEKAAAFVTDAGGILSHAAITAREMKKPCIIGTGIATRIFKDGDTVEVDANKGIARKV